MLPATAPVPRSLLVSPTTMFDPVSLESPVMGWTCAKVDLTVFGGDMHTGVFEVELTDEEIGLDEGD